MARVLDEAADVARKLADSDELQGRAAEVAGLVVDAVRKGGKILLCGNGGSAADSQHIAAELVGRFRRERPGYRAMALTTDTSVLTSVANDYGYSEVFRRQVEALGRRGDVLVALSTSGNAENVLRAVKEARRLGLRTVGMTGRTGGKLAAAVDVAVRAPSNSTARVQECHSIIGHAICDLVEAALAGMDDR